MNQITEEEEIENEIIETDDYSTELDIRLRRFKEFIDNKFANVKKIFVSQMMKMVHSILMKSMKCHLITQQSH